MKNKLLSILFFILLNTNLFAENLFIKAKNISIDKNKSISIFEDEVFIKTEDNKTIKSDYLEYNKSTGFLKLRKNIEVRDSKNNTIKTENAEYFENKKVFKSIGPTEVITSENFIIEGKDIIFDNNKKFINSNNNATLTDNDKNKIYLENFEYLINENIFKSIGLVKVEDVLGNVYEFSQIYIDTKKRNFRYRY